MKSRIFFVFYVFIYSFYIYSLNWEADSLEQWMDWEASANPFREYAQEARLLTLKYAGIPQDQVHGFGRLVDKNRWETFFSLPCPAGHLAFPVHPFNEDGNTLFDKKYALSPSRRSEHPFRVRLSASRTATLDLQNNFYTKMIKKEGGEYDWLKKYRAIGLKLPTSHVFRGVYEPNKSCDFAKYAFYGVSMSAYLSAIQEKIQTAFKIIPEVYVQTTITAEDGRRPSFVVRDLNVLDWKNNFYLPAFSVYTMAGQEIARKAGALSYEEIKNYWDTHLIKPIAELSAQLLVIYGLVQINPHSQQFLIEVNRLTQQPTGSIYLRDLRDLVLSNQVAPILGTQKLFQEIASRTGDLFNLAEVGLTEESCRIQGIIHDIISSLFMAARSPKSFLKENPDPVLELWEKLSWTLYDKTLRNTLGELLPRAKEALDKFPDFPDVNDDSAMAENNVFFNYYMCLEPRARRYLDIITSTAVKDDWEPYKGLQPVFEDLGF